MKIVSQLGIVLVVALVGEVVAGVVPVSLPGSVLGMVLMFLLLYFGVLRLPQVEGVADFFVGNMAILFIPITVGVVEIYPLLGGHVAGVVVMCIVVTLITFFAALGAAMLVMKLLGGVKGGEEC